MAVFDWNALSGDALDLNVSARKVKSEHFKRCQKAENQRCFDA